MPRRSSAPPPTYFPDLPEKFMTTAKVETDKANMTVQAAGAGVLEILVAEGETVAVGTPIARLGDGAVAAPSPESSLRSTPLARRAARDHGIALGSIESGSGAGGRIVMADVLAAEDASLMTLTLSCDHHILYGAEAAEFLAAVRDLLKAPLRVAL
jgi:pyruvate/2-oxoglutarate dehydrogenase complex dihydrolipoamide acyltransferase (E2) component